MDTACVGPDYLLHHQLQLISVASSIREEPLHLHVSSVHLDADPLNRDPSKFRNTNCAPKDADCAEWDPATLWIEPGFLTRTLMLSAFPAFMVGGLMVYLFARLGVNEVVSFMVFMPILIFVWFYVVGKVITKWGLRLGGRIRFAADGR